MKFQDQLGREIEVTELPVRIISLVPSISELMFDLGCGDRVIGITKFCVRPHSWKSEKTIVGGTKNVKHDVVRALQPDLILANREENTREQMEALAADFNVWVSDVKNYRDALSMIQSIGILTGTQVQCDEIIKKIEAKKNLLVPKELKRVAYLIWKNPWMTVNKDTFIHDMLALCGWENVFAQRNESRYPEVTWQEMVAANPQVVLLSSEPFPFNASHAAEVKHWLPNARVLFVDGEMFSWYGSRMIHAMEYFNKLISTGKTN